MTPDEIKGVYFPVLDKGFVALVDYMGNDDAVIQAARTSYGKGTKKVQTDRGLIRYLLRHRHTTPFEMVELKFHIGMPMDSWRQHIRHRTASVNEYSTRYSEAIDATAATKPSEWRLQSDSNKQGSGGFLQDPDMGRLLTAREAELHKMAREVYDERLQVNIAREQARKDLPLSTYTVAYWKIDLHNLLHFLTLRVDNHAQLEIRSFATVMAAISKIVAPVTVEAWIDYHFCSETFSRAEMVCIRELLSGHSPFSDEDLAARDLSKREIEEFRRKLTKPKEPPNLELDMSKTMPPEFFMGLYGFDKPK